MAVVAPKSSHLPSHNDGLIEKQDSRGYLKKEKEDLIPKHK
jgi:hypothetical protein